MFMQKIYFFCVRLINYNLFMMIFDFFGQEDCNFIAYSSILTFAAYLILARALNMAAGESCHAKLNKANAVFLAIYLAEAAAYCIIKGLFSIDILAAIIGGIFIFVSLQQIYFMALVGLAKKSVSVNIVETALQMEKTDEKKIYEKFSANTDYIRINRLSQMRFLGLAKEKNGIFSITERGRFFNRLGNLILKIWGLKRL